MCSQYASVASIKTGLVEVEFVVFENSCFGHEKKRRKDVN